MRYDIISDTHGYLSEALMQTLVGADVIVHAGDMCSRKNYEALKCVAPLHMCLGNNDWDPYDYDPDVEDFVRFSAEGLRWQLCHYERRLDLSTCDIAICGHTHRPFVRHELGGALMMNPGSPTWPRGGYPSMGRIIVQDGRVSAAYIINLADGRISVSL